MSDILEQRAHLEGRLRVAYNLGGNIKAEVDALMANSGYLRAAVALAEADIAVDAAEEAFAEHDCTCENCLRAGPAFCVTGGKLVNAENTAMARRARRRKDFLAARAALARQKGEAT